MDELVKKIVEQVYSVIPSSIDEIKGKGKNNLVFKVVINNNPLILRMSNREETLQSYQKEKWCALVARDAGIPTPKILDTDQCGEYAFSFQEYVEGVPGNDAPQELANIWFTLGRYANIIDKIPAPEIQLDYKEFVTRLFARDYFVTREVFSKELSQKIQKRLEETYVWKFFPTLCHGNLSQNNVIIDGAGTIHVIDWETATGNRAPYAELAEIYTWKTGKENIAHFLRGYGLEEGSLEEIMRDIQTLILLRFIHVIVRKMPKNNDWKQDGKTLDMVTKLSSIDDYQQDILFTQNL
ncbi:MAG: aminoglycoside phosphotransferase family protein [Patescibacteria group bacterium]